MKKTALIFVVMMMTLLLALKSKDDKPVTIVSGSLKIEVDKSLQSSVFSNEALTTKLSQSNISSGYLVIDDRVVSAFKLVSENSEKVKNSIGNGTRFSFIGLYQKDNISIEKKLLITVYDEFPEMAFFKVEYTNKNAAIRIDKWVNNHYTLVQNKDTVFWSFQGQSTEARADWILPVSPGFYQRNYMGMNYSDYGGGIPVSDLWRKDIGLAVGHVSLHPELVSLPVEMSSSDYAELSVEKRFKGGFELDEEEQLVLPETFVMLHHGDAFNALRKYAGFMKAAGIRFNKSPETAYEPVWCAWGYERKFTMEEVAGTLPKVKELGIKWAVIDDGYQIGEGDWNVDKKRFPEGNKAMQQMVNTIHDNGLKAKLWWAPLALDPCTPLWNNHYNEILLLNEDTSPRFITWWDAYYMSPVAEITTKETKNVLSLFFDEWDFDGLKMDGQHMNAVPPDYNELHGDNPELAPEKLPEFYQMVYDVSVDRKENAVVENCPCGCCVSFYNLAGMNQAVSSDPLNSWQIRLKGKVYHALNPDLAYYGDHVELSDNGSDFASSFGVGAVLGTKFTWPKDNPYAEASYLLTPEKEKTWKKWFALYNRLMLSKAEYLGSLYDIGFDKPETHVIKKDNSIYYSFFGDHWNGEVVFKGLDSQNSYQITDYVNNKMLSVLKAGENRLSLSFDRSILLVATPVGH